MDGESSSPIEPTLARADRKATVPGRGGFSLVEVIVSMLILALGALALVASSAVIARQLAEGAQMTVAATLAQSRLESLRAIECSAVQGGTAEQRGVGESWSVAREDGFVQVSDTVTLLGQGRGKRFVFESAIACGGSP